MPNNCAIGSIYGSILINTFNYRCNKLAYIHNNALQEIRAMALLGHFVPFLWVWRFAWLGIHTRVGGSRGRQGSWLQNKKKRKKKKR